MIDLNQLHALFKRMSDEDLSLMVPKDALRLEVNKIQTVHFAFWICYMAELDHGDILTKAWQSAKAAYGTEEAVINLIKKKHGIKIEKIDPDDPDHNEREVTFGDRIYIMELMAGKENEVVKMLWKLKVIRDDLSHGRINELNYGGVSLESREAKENLLYDYFRLGLNVDFSESPIWKQLSAEDRREIEEKFKQITSK